MARLAGFIKGTTRHCYTQNIKALGCVVSEKIFSSPEPKAHKVSLYSLRQQGQSQSNFICSITEEGERLHSVLGQVGLELWFPWQQIAPIEL